jgi:hypothetical protein
MAILTPEQGSKLEQIRLRRLGLASLAEPAVIEKFDLTESQKKEVADLLGQRDKDLAKADEKSARIIQAQTEHKLAAVLSEKQKSTWETISGGDAPRGETPKPMGAPAADAPKFGRPPFGFGPPKRADKAADSSVPKKEEADSSLAEQPSTAAPFPKADGKSDSKIEDKTGLNAMPPTLSKSEGTAEKEPKKHNGKIRFNFRYAPWKNVLDMFAEQADMSLVMDAPPPGTFNYTDDHEYTPAQAIDLVNSILLTKGYMLIRRERMLIVVNKADGIPPGLVQTITPDKLDERGEFELVCVLFNLDKLSPEEAEVEIKKLVGTEGQIVSLPKSRQIMVTETGGRLKAIRSLINRVEDPQNVLSGQIRTIDLKVPAEQLLPIIRSMLDFPDDKNVATDGSLRLAVDPSGRRILAQGKPEKLARLDEILKVVNVEQPGTAPVGIATTPQIENYPITSADPQTVFNVLQTLMQGLPDVRWRWTRRPTTSSRKPGPPNRPRSKPRSTNCSATRDARKFSACAWSIRKQPCLRSTSCLASPPTPRPRRPPRRKSMRT